MLSPHPRLDKDKGSQKGIRLQEQQPQERRQERGVGSEKAGGHAVSEPQVAEEDKELSPKPQGHWRASERISSFWHRVKLEVVWKWNKVGAKAEDQLRL